MESKFVLVDRSLLPDYYEKVMEAKRLIEKGEARNVGEASSRVGISRSTYYKYKDSIMTVAEANISRRANISMMLDHRSGILAEILNFFKECNCSIWTINQSTPIDNVANVVLTIELIDSIMSIDDIIEKLSQEDGVFKVRLMGVE